MSRSRPGREEILPLPHELAAEHFDLIVRRLADDLTHGTDASRFVGPGVEFAQSRPFEFGDSVRDIDWRARARTGRWHVKQYESEKRTPVHLIVDTSDSMGASSGPLTKHEVAVWITGTLAMAALRGLRPVAMMDGGERRVRMAPGMSRGQITRRLDELRTPPRGEGTRVAARLEEVRAMAPRMSMVFVLSDLHDPHALTSAARVAQRHDCALIQLIDPAERGGLRAGFFRGREAETGTGFVAGGRSRWEAGSVDGDGRTPRQRGLDHAEIKTNEPMIPALRRFLENRGGLTRVAR